MDHTVSYQKVVGEPFDSFVNTEIKNRQEIYASGFNNNRTASQIKYLQGKNSWVKMGSSVDVYNSSRLKPLSLSNNFGGFANSSLAKSAILFNTIGTGDVTSTTDRFQDGTYLGQFNEVNQNFSRSGVTSNSTVWNNSAYGFGGTEFGIQPPPGIVGFETNHLNRGSIQKSTINIKAYNKYQFDLIEILYLRLGFSMLVEFGHTHMLDSDGNPEIFNQTTLLDDFFFNPSQDQGLIIKSSSHTHLQIYQKIKDKQVSTNGNYNAIYGTVNNFEWNLNESGIYDITIHLTSLGSVVESLKINTLPPGTEFSKVNENLPIEENDPKVDRDAITNWLYCLSIAEQNPISPLDSPQRKIKKFNESTNLALVSPDLGPAQFNGQVGLDVTSWNTHHYIRFGSLLEYIQTKIIPHFKPAQGDRDYPMCGIDYTNISRCFTPVGYPLISFDPKICVIKPDIGRLDFLGIGNTAHKLWFENQLEDFFLTSEPFTGNILNIYLEFDFVQNLLNDNITNSSTESSITLYKFLTGICEGINSSLGHCVNLEPTIDVENNTLVIRDQNINPSTTNPLVNLPSESIPIEIYGIREDSSSFVKNFNFSTTITPNLSSLISIGATAANQTVSTNATAIQNWNQGLQDRFKSITYDGTQDTTVREDPNSAFTCANEKENSQIQSNQYINNRGELVKVNGNVDWTPTIRGLRDLYKAVSSDSVRNYRRFKDKNYYFNLGLALGVDQFNKTKFEEILGGELPLLTDNILQGTYFTENYTFANRIKSLFINKYTEEQNHQNPDTYSTNNIGFIPVNLKLELDGLSGIKIYNQLQVKTDLLPNNYPEVLSFVVMRTGHTLQDNQWVTTIEAIAKPTPIKR